MILFSMRHLGPELKVGLVDAEYSSESTYLFPSRS